MSPRLVLVSHLLCPYVQRAMILLAEKRIPFERIDIDLAHKPEWFLEVSPLGKTPVLLVDDQPIFESGVICEYLDETVAPRLHPADPLERARHRAWMEFSSATLNAIGALYAAPDAPGLRAKADELRAKFALVEAELRSHADAGPWFGGADFGLVDAAFGPVFRYFDVFDTLEDFGVFEGAPRVHTWRAALAARPSVRRAVREDYPALLLVFLRKRGSEMSRLVERRMVAA